MATSALKVAANRGNATLSTGPADTSRTRFNGLAHGLTSKQTVIRGESQEEYDTFANDLLQNLAPASPVESLLAERVIAAAWRLRRFTRVETSFFNNRIDAILEANPDSDPDAALATLFTDPAEMSRMRLFMRYQTTVQREYDKAAKEFQAAKLERQANEPEAATSNNINDYPLADAYVQFAKQPSASVGFASQPSPQREAAAPPTESAA